MIPPLQLELEHVAGRVSARRRHAWLAIFWSAAATAALGLVALRLAGFSAWWPVLVLIVAVVIGRWILGRRLRRPPLDLRGVARTIEETHPELHTGLLAAIDQDPENGRLHFLQTRVIDLALDSAQSGGWDDVAPAREIGWRRAVQRGAALLATIAVAALLALGVTDRVAAHRTAASLEVQPGNAEVERGSPVTFTARFSRDLPASASLQLTDAAGATRELPLTRPLEDPVFTAALPAVGGDLRYHVTFGNGRSETYTLKVFDPPRIEKVDATLEFPTYTGQPPAKLENPRTIAALEQTNLTLEIRTNTPMRSVELRAKDGDPIALTRDPQDPTRYESRFPLTRSGDFQLALTDEAGRANPAAGSFQIKVQPNRPPVVKKKLPSTRDRAGALQEVNFEAQVEDDFGLTASGLTVQIGGGAPIEIAGPALAAGSRKATLQHVVKLEDLKAKPNDLIVWNAWGEDLGPDGKPRRTKGDVNLLPVRAFDEITRQQEGSGEQQQPPPGENGGGQSAELIRLQTQILTATWNLQRDATSGEPPAADVETIRESQTEALELARQMEAEAPSAEMRQHVKSAQTEMERALEKLKSGRRDDLPGAIQAEQSALAYLYRLQPSEKNIMLVRGGAPGSESESSTSSEDLELKDMAPRYESETTPGEPPGEESREARENLNRLRDLAERQRDLNEELNRLQNAQRLAGTEAQRAEAERQLKRLQDQQRELKADLERARERMAQANTPAAPGQPDQQKELERAAAAAERSAQKLEAKELGEALAEGTRAQQNLERAESSYRQTATGQLAGQLRELREQARAVAEAQQQLGKELADSKGPLTPRTLRADPNSFDARAQKQAGEFQRLMDAVTNTAHLAAEAEPLVARRLDEAARESDPKRIAQALDAMRAEASVNERQAALDAQAAAAQGLEQLRQRVSEATAQVLGSETEALQYAQAELDRLRRALNSPTADRQPANASAESQPGTQQGSQPGGQPGSQPEESPGPENAPGNSPGESRQPGTQPSSEPSDQPGGRSGSQPGNQPGTQPGNQPGQAPGPGNAPGESPGEAAQAGSQPGPGPGGDAPGESPGSRPGRAGGGIASGGGAPGGDLRGGARGIGPILENADDYREWTDRLQDLEALVELPEARVALARARGAARDLRGEARRTNTRPPQKAVDLQIVQPLLEAEARIQQALAAADRGKNPLAPVERDPVPERYSELVQRYYEALGQ